MSRGAPPRGRPSLALVALALAAMVTSCRSPTSVTLVLSSDVACDDHPTTSVTVSRTASETLAPSLVTRVCNPDGHIGTLVVVPASDRDEDLRVRVVTRVGEATCEAPGYGTGCIVSRRQLRFLAHEELTVPIAQQVDCAGVACGATTTCRQGQCVEAQVDQDRCEANPGECGSEIVTGVGGSSGASGQVGAAGSGVVRPPLPPLPPGAGTGTTYYVSPGGGDDSNDGTSQATAWKTLDRVASGSFGPGDSVLLEGGADVRGCLVLTGDRVASTPDAPFTLGAYGGKPFHLTAACGSTQPAALHLTSLAGVIVTDGVIRDDENATQFGILVDDALGAPARGVRIQRCDISGFESADGNQVAAEIRVRASASGVDGVQILGNVLHGADGPTSHDEVGVQVLGGERRVTGVLVQGNEIHDIGGKGQGKAGMVGDGVLLTGVDGAVVQYNVVHHGGARATTCRGPRGIGTSDASDVTIQYNEVYAMGPAGGVIPAGACGWAAYVLDAGTTGSRLQYNYAHDNAGPGFVADVSPPWSGNSIRYNISQGDGGGIRVEGTLAATSDLAVVNNTVHARGVAASGISLQSDGTVAGHVASNLFVLVDGARAVVQASASDGVAFRGNAYWAPGGLVVDWRGTTHASLDTWAEATGQETLDGKRVGLVVDPLLTSPGGGATYGGYAPSEFTAYRLLPGSPLRGAGLDTAALLGLDPGPTDYFGVAVPHSTGSGFNIGADGSP